MLFFLIKYCFLEHILDPNGLPLVWDILQRVGTSLAMARRRYRPLSLIEPTPILVICFHNIITMIIIMIALIVVITIHRSWWSTHPHRPHSLAFHALASFTAPWGRPVHYIINKHKQPLQPTMPPVIWCRRFICFLPSHSRSRQPLKSPSIAGGAVVLAALC